MLMIPLIRVTALSDPDSLALSSLSECSCCSIPLRLLPVASSSALTWSESGVRSESPQAASVQTALGLTQADHSNQWIAPYDRMNVNFLVYANNAVYRICTSTVKSHGPDKGTISVATVPGSAHRFRWHASLTGSLRRRLFKFKCEARPGS